MRLISRGAQRKSRPDIFISHSSKDKEIAANLAIDLNFCSVDVWLDQWELQIGQSLTDEIAKAMNDSRYIAILITSNYNKTVWTKTEYKKALSREQSEGRTVMLPLIVGQAEIPDFLEEKIYLDLRTDYYSGLARIAAMVHNLSEFRMSRALASTPPTKIRHVWKVFEDVGFKPYVVLGDDDFNEILKNGGELVREDYASFNTKVILNSTSISKHIRNLLRELVL